MFFDIDKKKFENAVNKAALFCKKNTAYPILSHLFIETNNNQELIIRGSNLESGIKITTQCEIRDQGKLTLPAEKIIRFLKEAPDGNLSIEVKKQKAFLKIREINLQITFLDPDLFPIPDEEPPWLTSIPTEILQKTSEVVFFAAAEPGSIREGVLENIYFEKTDNGVRVVATDGHRLALFDWDKSIDLSLDLESPKLVPKIMLANAVKLLSKTSQVEIGFNEKNCFLKNDDFIISCRLIDDKFPNYKAVLINPENSQSWIQIDRNELISALRQLSIFITKQNKCIHINWDNSRLKMVCDVTDNMITLNLPIKSHGNSINLDINCLYLLDSVNAINSEQIKIDYFGEKKPLLLRPEPEESYFNIVMPLRLEK